MAALPKVAQRSAPRSRVTPRSLPTHRERDDETDDASGDGLMYYRARHYDPRIGRFVQNDPLLILLHGILNDTPRVSRERVNDGGSHWTCGHAPESLWLGPSAECFLPV